MCGESESRSRRGRIDRFRAEFKRNMTVSAADDAPFRGTTLGSVRVVRACFTFFILLFVFFKRAEMNQKGVIYGEGGGAIEGNQSGRFFVRQHIFMYRGVLFYMFV